MQLHKNAMIESAPSHVINSLKNNFESVSVCWWQHFWYECVSVHHAKWCVEYRS